MAGDHLTQNLHHDYTARRGRAMPKLSAVERRLAFLTDLIAAFRIGRIDLDAMARGRFGAGVKSMLEKNGVSWSAWQ